MNLSENIRLAWEGLVANKMRALLTMLGIIIGIMSVIAILTVGTGLSSSLGDSMSSLGMSNIRVSVSLRDSENTSALEKSDRMTDEMLDALQKRYPEEIVGFAISESIGNGKVTEGRDSANVSLDGINTEYLDINEVNILHGRGILERDNDGRRSVAVVSDKLIEKLFGGQTEDVLGQEISVSVGNDSYKFFIVGVYEYEEDDSMFSSSADDDVSTGMYIPITTSKRLTGTEDGYTSLTVSASASVDSTIFAEQIEKFFEHYYEKNDYWYVTTMSMESIMEMMNSMMGTVKVALTIIAGISLLVGGIGVMNIMLVSVTERTREIGTRKALGATNGNIRIQFVVESVIVCLFGGLIGVVMGAVMGYAGSALMGFPSLPSLGSIILSFGFAMGIGIFFGYYPANKAAKLDPIEALRYE